MTPDEHEHERSIGDDAVDEEYEAGALVPIGAVMAGVDEAQRAVASEVYARESKRAKEPPHVLHAERDVLAAVVTHGAMALDVCEEVGLRGADFFELRGGLVYDAAMAVRARGAIISITSISDQLHRRAQLGAAGGQLGVHDAFMQRLDDENAEELIDHLPAWIDGQLVDAGLRALRTHAELVREHSRRRSIIDVARKAVVAATTGQDSSRILDETQSSLSRIEAGTAVTSVSIAEVADRLTRTLPAFGFERRCLATGFHDVDGLLSGGFSPGDLVVVAARPSMGKTEWMLNLMGKVCIDRGKAAMFFSLEMDNAQLVTRIAGSRARVNPMRKNASQAQITRLLGALGDASKAHIYLDDTPALDIARLRARARAQHRKDPLSLLGIDYIQLLVGGEGADSNRNEMIGDMTRGLKALGRELGIPIVALSQLNRGVEMRADKRPMMSDLRESGAIEQDADVIAFLYREEYYSKEKCPADKVGVAEFILGKNRNGPTGTVRLHFGGHENDPADAPPRFENLARGHG